MSFPFKTLRCRRRRLSGMNTPTHCPYHAAADADDASAVHPLHPPGAWPPGPPSGLTGWGLLRQMSRDLLGTLDRWRERYGDLVHLRIWPEHQVVLSDPALVRELLIKHHADLVRWERGTRVLSQLHGHSVFIAEGEAWRTRRQALQPAFLPKPVHGFVPAIAAATRRAFERWQAGSDAWPIESAFTSLGMDVIVRTMFSSEIDADARAAERAVHDTAVAADAELYWPASWPDWAPWKRAKRDGIRLLGRLIARHVEARLALPQEAWPQDLLSRLLALHREDPAAWPLQAVHDECMTAFMAGHETSAATLTWWAWCMAANPSAQDAARREVDTLLQGRTPTAADLPALAVLTRTLQETLRLYPAAPLLLTRRALRPITLGGWQFPARTLFSVPLRLMHHDPRWFPDPQTFRPERFADDAPAIPRGAYMPFGAGARVCLGQHLAMTEMTVIAAMFLQRFTVAVPEGMAAPEPALHITLRPAQQLRLQLTARAS
jgi:cytochrome P450